MCVGKPEIRKNVRTLLSEFAEVFKYSRYIHIGCDEALHTNWTACHYCRDYMARQGIGTTMELYAHFVALVVDICLSLGRTPLLWEGFHKEYNHLVSKDAVIMSWSNNFQRVEDTLDSGFRVINAGYSPIYLMGSFPPDYSIVKEGFDMYRWNVTDPIYFTEDLRVTIQALGWRSGKRYMPLQDDISSVAYWYSDSLEDDYPPLPEGHALDLI
jgi:hypothetical protein